VRLYRVFPCVSDAAEREPGGPLYAPPGGQNRIDNPDLYSVLYASSHPEAAVAEWLGRFPIWTAAHFNAPRSVPHATISLVTFDAADDRVVDLDDAHALVAQRLRPSDVVTRDYARSQAWAARIYRDSSRVDGVRWWSYYNPDWGTFGRWRTPDLSVSGIEPLTVDHPATIAAASVIVRRIDRARRLRSKPL
jgi:hypothetical protein